MQKDIIVINFINFTEPKKTRRTTKFFQKTLLPNSKHQKKFETKIKIDITIRKLKDFIKL